MRLDGRRESSNVDDRRRMSGGQAAGLGLGGIVVVGLITLLMGGNLGDVLNIVTQNGGTESAGQNQEVEFTQEEQELVSFAKKILAGTEDIWTAQFAAQGHEYRKPKMVLYTGATSSGCGSANSSIGPFYCSADESVYIDLSFFASMSRQLGADGDFAYAYVIAHEVGHHMQHLLGILDQAHRQMARKSKVEANKISVRLELQADYLAGMWAKHDNQQYQSLEDGDLEEAIRCASVIGDDYLQKKSQGYVVEDAFTHGTAAQRMRWLKAGLTYGDFGHSDTFRIDESQL